MRAAIKSSNRCYLFVGISILLIFCILILGSCTKYRLKKNLNPENREFLSKVRYIITSQEEKIFLLLPPSERENFIQEFWKKRDPDPETEKNEYKQEYFERIEEANQLFRDGTSPGWLQDRGRVYILLGRPDNRRVFPRGYSFYGKPMEIWYYGFFPIVFIDRNWTDDYRLSPDSAYQISQINKAQMDRKLKVEDKDVVLDFDMRVTMTEENQALVRIEVPYRNIWFKDKDGQMVTTLALNLEIFDASKKKVWEYKKDYSVSLEESALEDFVKEAYAMEVEAELDSGSYTVVAEIENKTDQTRARKRKHLEIPEKSPINAARI